MNCSNTVVDINYVFNVEHSVINGFTVVELQ